MNSLITVVGITIVSLLLVSSFNKYKKHTKRCQGQGYGAKELKDSYEDTEEEQEAIEEGEE